MFWQRGSHHAPCGQQGPVELWFFPVGMHSDWAVIATPLLSCPRSALCSAAHICLWVTDTRGVQRLRCSSACAGVSGRAEASSAQLARTARTAQSLCYMRVGQDEPLQQQSSQPYPGHSQRWCCRGGRWWWSALQAGAAALPLHRLKAATRPLSSSFPFPS